MITQAVGISIWCLACIDYMCVGFRGKKLNLDIWMQGPGCASTGFILFKDGYIVNALHVLSVGLCRGNCALYKQSLYALACIRGNAFCAGADIPTFKANWGFILSVQILFCPSASPCCCSFTSLGVVTRTHVRRTFGFAIKTQTWIRCFSQDSVCCVTQTTLWSWWPRL